MKKQKEEKLILPVILRNIFGKKLKTARKENKIPANIFGQNFKSISIFVDFKTFQKIYKKAKETAIIYLLLEKKEIPVLIQNIQKHPVTDQILHIDFRKIDLTKTIQTNVPIKIIGQSEAIEQKQGVLIHHLDKLLIEAKPEKIPSEIVIDISSLKDLNQEVKIADLPKSPDYKIINPEEKPIISVIAHKEEEIKQPEIVKTETSTEEKKEIPPDEKTTSNEPTDKTTEEKFKKTT